MKKTIFWCLLLTVCATSIWWLTDILIMSKKEYNQFRGAAKVRQGYAANGGVVGLAAAGDWSAHPSLLNGIHLAVDEINAAGGLLGRKIGLTPVDDRGSLEGAFEATQQICEKADTLFVIGHSRNRLTQAVVQNYEFYGILMVSPLSANLTQSQKNFQLIFSNSTPLDIMSERLLALARQNRWSQVGMLYSALDFDTDLVHHFESRLVSSGIKMPLILGVYPGQEDLEELLKDQPHLSQVDALVVAAANRDALTMVRHCRKSGFTRPIILGQKPETKSLKEDSAFWADIYCPDQITTESFRYQGFSKAYSERFGGVADLNAVSGYDTVMILADAINKAQSLEATVVAQTMKSFTPHSLTGTMGFDTNGNAVKTRFDFILMPRGI